MTALVYRMRSWLRVRTRVLGALVLVVAVSGAGVLVLAAGAVRTLTAPDRYSDFRGDVWDVSVEQSDGPPRTAELAALPAADEVAMATFVFGSLGERVGGGRSEALVFAGSADAFSDRVVEGHPPADAEPLGFVASAGFVRASGAELGDEFELVVLTQAQVDELGFDLDPAHGTALTGTLVGVLDGPASLDDDYEVAVFPQTLLDHADIGVAASVGAVSLAPGATNADLRRQIRALPDGQEFALDEAEWVSSDIRAAVSAQGQGIVVLASIVALATVVVLGQLLGRNLRLDDAERSGLQAVGLTRRQLMAEPTARGVLAVGLGVVGADVIAYLASGRFPYDFVRRLEPDPGRRFDPLVHGAGPVLLALALLAWIVGAVALEARGTDGRRPTTLADRVAALVPSPRVATGLRFAFTRPARGARSVAAPLIGLTLAATVLFGALTFGASLRRVVDRPEAWGVNFDLGIGTGAAQISEEIRRGLAASDDVGAVTLYGTTTVTAGERSIGVVGMEPVRGGLRPEVLDGRLPTGAGEIGLGPVLADALSLEPGDRLEVHAPAGARPFDVTGVLLVPPIEGVDELGNAALVSADALRELDVEAGMSTAAVRVAGDSDEGAEDRIAATVGTRVAQPDPPPAIVNLRRVRSIPFLVALAVGGLAVLSLAHQMLTAVRRRRRDLAILRALGASPRWLQSVVHWQTTVTIGLVLAVAVPAGGALGRVAFRVFVEHVGVQVRLVFPVAWIGGGVLALLVAANLVAAATFRSGARRRLTAAIEQA